MEQILSFEEGFHELVNVFLLHKNRCAKSVWVPSESGCPVSLGGAEWVWVPSESGCPVSLGAE